MGQIRILFLFCYLCVTLCSVSPRKTKLYKTSRENLQTNNILESVDIIKNTWKSTSKKTFHMYDQAKESTIEQKLKVDEDLTLKRGINGGFPCAACAVLLGMSAQLADINNGTLFDGLDILCSYLPTDLGSECSILIHVPSLSIQSEQDSKVEA